MKTLKTVVTALIVLCVCSVSAQKGYKVGDYVEDFKLKNVDGKMTSLSDFKNAKGFIVTFTCNTCPYAIMYEDRIMALDKKYAKKGYPVIAIMPNNVNIVPGDSFEAMQKRAETKGYTFPYLMDEKQTVFPQFGATKTPHVYVVQKTPAGNQVKYIGAIDDSARDASKVNTKYVEDAVDALIEGKHIKQTETRAIGCSIKV